MTWPVRLEVPPNLDSFLRAWSEGIRDADPIWEGRRAWTELKRKGALEVIRFQGEWRKNWMTREPFERIWDSVQEYKGKRELLFTAEMKETEEFLAKEQERIKRRMERTKTPLLAGFLARVAAQIDDELPNLVAIKKKGLVSPLGIWETLFLEERVANRMVQGLDLDNKLQTQIAKMLWICLREYGVKRKTIARLVCLAYWKMGLAAPNDGVLRILNTNRSLTVKAVDEKLRRTRIFEGLREKEARLEKSAA